MWLCTLFLFLNIFPLSFHQSFVCWIWIGFSTNFWLLIFFTCQKQTDLCFFLRVLAAMIYWPSSSSSMSHVYFKCFMSTCCSSTFILSSWFTSMAFLKFTFILYKTVCSFSMLFTHYFLFHILSSWLILPSQHQCLPCNFQPHNWRGINDRL